MINEPSGNFVLEGENVVGICAGSGITPILSMLKSGKADFKLVYGNKTESSTMFYEEIKEQNSDNYFVKVLYFKVVQVDNF